MDLKEISVNTKNWIDSTEERNSECAIEPPKTMEFVNTLFKQFFTFKIRFLFIIVHEHVQLDYVLNILILKGLYFNYMQVFKLNIVWIIIYACCSGYLLNYLLPTTRRRIYAITCCLYTATCMGRTEMSLDILSATRGAHVKVF